MNYFENVPKTAAAVVEKARQASTTAINYIPHAGVQDVTAKITNLQFSIADVLAEQFDKAAASVQNYMPKTK